MATTFSPPAPTYNVLKSTLRWNPDGTRTLTLVYQPQAGGPPKSEDFVLNATQVLDRNGALVLAQSGGFQTALATVETSIDGAIAGLQAAGKLNPP